VPIYMVNKGIKPEVGLFVRFRQLFEFSCWHFLKRLLSECPVSSNYGTLSCDCECLRTRINVS
jgi:hypothetical protein